MVSPAVIKGAIFNVSLLLIVLNDFPKFVNFCQKIRGFLKKNSGIVENYF